MSREITLCLSGGGFRAAIFHLGVIDSLVQTDRFKLVRAVYGVSGGAVTAAHVAQNWPAYSDPQQYCRPALELLNRCHVGVLDQVIWHSLILQKKRSVQFAKELAPLFGANLPVEAKPTYVVCSSLTDTSQFAVELKSHRLMRLLPDRRTIKSIGVTNIKTSQAVAMSACFPVAFEPIALDGEFTGLDTSALGRDHIVADGGIVDNSGLAMAHANETGRAENHLFLVSDAGQIFDDLDARQADLATILSPMRTIDYLMSRNAESTLASIEPLIKIAGAEIAVVKLSDVRRLVDSSDLSIDAGVIRAGLRLRTNFNSFSVAEIVALYRFGLLVAKDRVDAVCGPTDEINPAGIIAGERLGRSDLNMPWGGIKLDAGEGSLGKLVEFVLRKPGIALLAVSVVLFAAAVALGVGVRALGH